MEDTQVENTSTEMSEVNLIDAVKKQVEYYFSKENLLSDPYLTSQMDAQMCVPINVVMKFAKMKALTQDESLLRKALVDSTIVSILDNKIKANIKPPGRSTIILREIPSDAPPAEVAEIFNYPGAKTTTSIRSEIGDTWFVTMDTEEDAKDTLLDLRLKKRTFRGVSVKARLKTETVVRSFFPVNANPVAPFPGIMAPGVPMVDMRAFGYMGMPVPLMNADGSPVDVAVETPAVAAVPASNETRNSPGKAAAPAASSTTTPAAAAGAAKKGSATGKAATAGNNNGTAAASGRRQEGSAASGSNARSGAKGANGHKDGKKEETVPRATIEINVANFPPLGGGEDLPVPTPGYKGAFQKYNADEIISIAKGVKETNLPATLKPQAHPLSMTVEANKDLLKRQRSFSIDETREQLRQGRPVMRDAVLPGKVDSRSLYYGDEAPSAGVPAAAVAKKETAPAAPASAHTTPSQGKKAPKEVAAPVAAPTEATTVASEVVDHVAAAAANLAITSPTASESAHMASPQKITPSTWAAMLKSSASAADALPLPVRTPAKEVKRTPAKDASKAPAAKPATAAKGEKEASTEGRNRRKNSEGSREGSRPAKTEKEGSTSGSVTGANARRKAEPGTPSRGNANKESTDSKAEGETAAKAESSVSWGGKASFANILKLSAESEPFVPASATTAAPAASSSARAPTTKDTSGSNSHNAERRKGDRAAAPKSSSTAGAKTAAPPAATSSANGEWSTSTGKSRAPREAKDKDAAKDKTPGNNGANAKGAWARETLPALPAVGAENKA